VPAVPVTGRFDLTDAQWAVLEPLLPRGKKPGRPPTWTRRQLIDDPVAGPHRGAVAGRPGPIRALDIGVRAVPPLAAGRHLAQDRKGDLQAEPACGIDEEPAGHGLGRSRGGLTSKVHLACEQRQKPLAIVITAGQRGDSPQFQVVPGRIRYPGPAAATRAPGRTGFWPTRPTAPGQTAPTCGDARSPAPSRRKQTRSATAKTRAAQEAGRRPSIQNATSSATPSNAASTGSSATAP
jgi:hypothetical protein